MPWELTIRRADGSSLDDLAVVRRLITHAIPSVQFYREPSGPEKIAAARAVGVEFPEVIHRFMEQAPATEQAEFEGERFSVRFYGFENQPLRALHAEIRGEGNPLPFLAAICLANGWVVVDRASGQLVDLAGDTAAGWELFREYRRSAIQKIKQSGRQPEV